ncbi:MAG: glycosyltransferase [Sedimentisphaerales bacterium]|nr:glycosyltransferase [Sedimentisphaerales bacterium]
MSRRFKILISAYACEPYKGSEPEVGWQWVCQIARTHDVWVLTRANNIPPIEASGLSQKYPNLAWIGVEPPRWLGFWKKGQRGTHLYYALWQMTALIVGWRLHRKIKFDLTHHLTFSPFYWAPLIGLLPVPFVWGPVGAGEVVPRPYWLLFSFGQKIRETIRLCIRKASIWNPFVYGAMRKARFILAATEETRRAFPQRLRNKVIVEAQIGIDPVSTTMRQKPSDDVFRIVTAGRHVYWKGHILILRAFARFHTLYEGRSELVLLSDGPQRPGLEEEARRLGVADVVRFVGWLPKRQDVFREYEKADLFAYASLFECGGYVVMEAMSCGVPVVTLGLGGPGEMVTDDCGVVITPSSIKQTIDDFALAFHTLAQDRSLLRDKNIRTVQRIEQQFRWSVKGDRLLRWLDGWTKTGSLCDGIPSAAQEATDKSV